MQFSGEPVYLPGAEPDAAETAARVERYWRPYHDTLDAELATVGLSEQRARELHGEAVSVHTSRFHAMVHALARSPQSSLFKLVCVGEEERVVGIHLLGETADEILQGFAVALKLGVTRRQLQDTIAIHPTSAEEVVLMP